jgi:4-diphosphocytidyl-2C-methyl-D-erythritol kinase
MVRDWADRLKTHAQSIGLPTEAVRMSGSGGALFASCATQFEAVELAKTLVESGFDADRIRLCKTLARHPSAEQLP